MAVVKLDSTRNSIAAIRYLLNTKSHDGIHPRVGSISARWMDPYDAAESAKRTLKRFKKWNDRVAYPWERPYVPSDEGHVEARLLIQSFHNDELDPDDQEDLDKANRAGYELARRVYGDDRQFLVVTQADNGNVHNHIVCISPDLTTGRSVRGDAANFYHVKKVSDEVLAEHGIANINAQKEAVGGYTNKKHIGEIKRAERGEYVWKDDLKGRIEKALADSAVVDEESFNLALLKLDVDARFRGKGIGYAFTDEGGKQRKARGATLGTLYGLERVKALFEENQKALAEEERRREAETQKAREEETQLKALNDIDLMMKLEAERGRQQIAKMRAELAESDARAEARRQKKKDPEWMSLLKYIVTEALKDKSFKDREGFQKYLAGYGIDVRFRGKNVTYVVTEGEKTYQARGRRLGAEFDVEAIDSNVNWTREILGLSKVGEVHEPEDVEVEEPEVIEPEAEERNTAGETRVEPEKDEDDMFDVVSEKEESFKDKVARRLKSRETEEIKLPKIHIGPEKMEPEPEPEPGPEEEFVEGYEDEIPADLVDDYEEPGPQHKEPESVPEPALDDQRGKVYVPTEAEAMEWLRRRDEAEMEEIRQAVKADPSGDYARRFETASQKLEREGQTKWERDRQKLFEKLEKKPVTIFDLAQKIWEAKPGDPDRPTFRQFWSAGIYALRMERKIKKLGFKNFEEFYEHAKTVVPPPEPEAIPGFLPVENRAVYRASKAWYDVQDHLHSGGTDKLTQAALEQAKAQLAEAGEYLDSRTKAGEDFKVVKRVEGWETSIEAMTEKIDKRLEEIERVRRHERFNEVRRQLGQPPLELMPEGLSPVEQLQWELGQQNNQTMKPKFLGREF